MANNDFTQFLETLKQRCDIVSTVSRYVPLEKKGNKYWACCPFHREKTPSFTVNPDGFYKCFGCGESGDVIKFVQSYENMDFSDAVAALAKTAGLEVPAFKKDDSGASDAKQRKELYTSICTDAAKFYYKALSIENEQTQKTMEYLTKRGIDGAAIKKFGIGLSPDFDSLPKFLSKKYKTEDCIAAGVLSKSEKGKVFDALAERLIFPIISVYGSVVGFGGRILKKSDFAKYKNTSQTLIFDKSKNLFAINNIKKFKQNSRAAIDYIIIVEGYMDAVSLIQAGYECTVASMGTSLTQEQAKLARRFSDKVVISYDGDSAGQAATLRGLEILKAEGLNVRVAALPDGLDPDDMIKKRGKDAYQKCLDTALPLTDYRLKIIKDKYNFEGTGAKVEEAKRLYLEEALPVVRELSGTEKESYIKILSRQTGFAPDFLKKEAEKKSEIKSVGIIDNSVIIKDTRNEAAVKFILAAMIFNKHFAADFDLAPYITRAGHAEIYDYIVNARKGNKIPVPSMAYDITDDRDAADEILNTNFGSDDTAEKFFQDCVKALTAEDDKNRLEELKQNFKTETNPEKRKEIMRKIQEIDQKRRNNS